MRRGEGEEPPPAPLCPALPLPQVLRTEVPNVCPGRVYLPQLLEEEEGVEVEGKVEVEEGPTGGSGGGRPLDEEEEVEHHPPLQSARA